MLKIIPVAALVTSALMIYLAFASLRDDLKKPRARIRQSLNLLALTVGFVCMFLTALWASIFAFKMDL